VLGVLGVSILLLSMICRLNFFTFPTVCYFIFLFFLMTYLLLNSPTLNKRLIKLMGQSRMDNSETLTTLDTEDTRRRQTKQRQK